MSQQAPREIAGYRFHFVGVLEVERNHNGSVVLHSPQERYEKRSQYRLHRYGDGAFCRFRLSASASSGVYAFVVGEQIRYVGECVDLGSRMNTGYGNISPKNCYEGGQQTNCRVNQLVLAEAQRGNVIAVWFYACANHKQVEPEVIRAVSPPWNRETRSSAISNLSFSNAGARIEGARIEESGRCRSAAPRTVTATLPRLTRSSVEKPVQMVWRIADEMFARNRDVSRRDILDECRRRGVAENTAKTQYQLWKTFRRSQL
jgi:hypothetical protein